MFFWTFWGDESCSCRTDTSACRLMRRQPDLTSLTLTLVNFSIHAHWNCLNPVAANVYLVTWPDLSHQLKAASEDNDLISALGPQFRAKLRTKAKSCLAFGTYGNWLHLGERPIPNHHYWWQYSSGCNDTEQQADRLPWHTGPLAQQLTLWPFANCYLAINRWDVGEGQHFDTHLLMKVHTRAEHTAICKHTYPRMYGVWICLNLPCWQFGGVDGKVAHFTAILKHCSGSSLSNKSTENIPRC